MKKMNKGLCLLLGSVLAFGSISLLGGEGVIAYAGEENKQIVSETFSSTKLDMNYWMKYNSRDKVGLTAEEGSFAGLNVLHAQGGSGLVSSSVIAEGARLEVDFDRYEAPVGGWLALNFGTMITGTDLIDYGGLATGKVFFLVYNGTNWMLYSHAENALDFTDGAGNPLQVISDVDSDGNVIVRQYVLPAGLIANGAIVEKKTVVMHYGNDGTAQLSVKDNVTGVVSVLAKTSKMGSYQMGRVGCSFTGMNTSIGNAYVNDVRVYALNGASETVVAQMKEENSNPLVDFIQYISPQTGAFFYGRASQLTFDKEADSNSMVTYMVPFSANNKVTKNNFSVQNTLRVKELKGGKRFGMFYGLRRYMDFYQAEGVCYVYLTNTASGIAVGAVTYDGSGNERTLLAETPVPAGLNLDECTFKLVCDKDFTTSVYIDGVKIASFTGVDYTGYFGYALGGSETDDSNYAHVFVDDVLGNNRVYTTPRTADVFADFNNEYLNINEWKLSDYGGNIRQKSTGTYIKDGKMFFDNVNANAHLTSVPQYSNFEFDMQITDIQREPVFGEKGMERPASSWIGFMYGVPEKPSTWTSKDQYRAHYSYSNLNGIKRCPLVTFSAIDINADGFIDPNTKSYLRIYNVSMDAYNALGENKPANWTSDGTYISIELEEKYNIFSMANDGKVVDVKATMTDGLLVIKMKYADETEYHTACEYDTGTAPVGSISIRGYGAGEMTTASSFMIDNVSVKNTDTDKLNTENYGSQDNKRTPTPSFTYQSVLKKENLIEGEELTVGIGAAAAAITTTIAVAYVVGKRW